MQHRRGELCSPVNRIYTKSGRTQFAPTGYDCFFAVMKHKKGTPRRRSFKRLIDFWSVEGAGVRWTPLRQQKHRPNRQVRPPLPTKKTKCNTVGENCVLPNKLFYSIKPPRDFPRRLLYFYSILFHFIKIL